MEKWDLYDENRKPLNKIHHRGEELRLGENHIVVDIWTINSNREILLTLRDPDKQTHPNYWENTAGSVLAGESSSAGAARELLEETGIKVREDELVYLGTKKEVTAFVDSYITKKDVRLSDLILQKGETVAAKWVSEEELNRMILKEEIAPPVIERLALVRDQFDKIRG